MQLNWQGAIVVIKEAIENLKGDAEALAVMAGLGFIYKDWPFIKKVGVSNVMSSDLMHQLIRQKINNYGQLETILCSMRSWFDSFYKHGGYLISPLSHSSSRLFRSPEAPLIFYGRYNQQLVHSKPCVSVVGSRVASQDALKLTKKLAQTLSEHHITVISGGAMGIDQAAHEGALSNGGATVMVLGVPCDKAGHEVPMHMVADKERVAIIHPFGPLTPKGKFMFVERNRYVASLADALVIVQGQQGSGTLHTAKFAHDLGVAIYAIPGAVLDPRSYVANHLLHHQKAQALVDFAHFVNKLAITPNNKIPSWAIKKDNKTLSGHQLPYLLKLIYDHQNALTFDELIALTGKSFIELQKELLDYELAGRITKQASQFVLIEN